MSAGEVARAWLLEHGPIHRPDGSALSFLAEQIGVQTGTLGLALRRMSTASPPSVLRRTKGIEGRGGTIWIGLPAQADQAPAEEVAPPEPIPERADPPPGWTAGCDFCERDPQRTCAMHRPASPAAARAAEPEEAPKSGLDSPAEASPPAPARVASVTPLPTAAPAPRRTRSTQPPDEVEPAGLREEFIALQASYATLVDELAGMKERVIRQAGDIGTLKAQKARLMSQVASLSADLTEERRGQAS